MGTVIRIARPESRAEALSGLFLAGFVGMSVPIVGAGVALAEGVSPRGTLLAFAIAVAIGIVASAIKLLPGPARRLDPRTGSRRKRSSRTAPHAHAVQRLVEVRLAACSASPSSER